MLAGSVAIVGLAMLGGGVPIEITDYAGCARQGWPATGGVPLPRGAVTDPTKVWLTDPGGRAIRLQREPLSRAEALEIFLPLARALSAMHAAGVRHQDVKPENIFLARIPGFGEDVVTPVLLDLVYEAWHYAADPARLRL